VPAIAKAIGAPVEEVELMAGFVTDSNIIYGPAPLAPGHLAVAAQQFALTLAAEVEHLANEVERLSSAVDRLTRERRASS